MPPSSLRPWCHGGTDEGFRQAAMLSNFHMLRSSQDMSALMIHDFAMQIGSSEGSDPVLAFSIARYTEYKKGKKGE